MEIYGKGIENKEILKYIGHTQQVMGLKKYILSDGFADGVQCVDVNTGAGLEYTVVLSRALDISFCKFKGQSLTHISPIGAVAPSYFDASGDEWLRSFGVGMLTSVGINQAGEPNECCGKKYGQHGRLSNLPAANVALHEDFTDKGFEMSVTGEMTQWKQADEHLFLRRKISSVAGDNTIYIHDEYENRSWTESPFMILYHFNLGFPFLNENTEFIIPNSGMTTMYPDKPMIDAGIFGPPEDKNDEEVFIYDTKADDEGFSYVLVISDKNKEDLALLWKFPKAVLPNCGQWLMNNYQNYVVGIEPCNNNINGIADAQKDGSLRYIKAQEKIDVDIELKVLCGDEVRKCKQRF